MKPPNEYSVFFTGMQRGETIKVYAATSYEAQQIAAEVLAIPPRSHHKITVVLTHIDGEPTNQLPHQLY